MTPSVVLGLVSRFHGFHIVTRYGFGLVFAGFKAFRVPVVFADAAFVLGLGAAFFAVLVAGFLTDVVVFFVPDSALDFTA